MNSINGTFPGGDDPDDSADEFKSVNGIPPLTRDGRSVSSTLHDRASSRSSTATPTNVSSASASSSRRQSSPKANHSHRHSNVNAQGSSATPPPGHHQAGGGTAKETFLNYFFGQNGAGPLPGSSMALSSSAGPGNAAAGVTPVGRDLYGGEKALESGLMAGKRNLEGNDAAYDMKSLGKHIEAVSVSTIPNHFIHFSVSVG